jgi:hypothetical protein
VTTDRRKPVSRRHRISNATPRELYDVLVDFRAYPQMSPSSGTHGSSGCKPDIPSVDWTFVEGTVVEGSAGSWRLSREDGGTVVEYTASLDVRAPLPRFVLRK